MIPRIKTLTAAPKDVRPTSPKPADNGSVEAKTLDKPMATAMLMGMLIGPVVALAESKAIPPTIPSGGEIS